MHYKRFDLIIDAFARLGLPLKIVGSGPESQNLKFKIENLKLRNVELSPFVNDENELRKLYNGAQALIFPQVEDFGLVAAEAQACGTPVIAFAGGGALEIIEEEKKGFLFRVQNAGSLIEAVAKFQKMNFDRPQIAESAKRFSQNKFKEEMMSAVDKSS